MHDFRKWSLLALLLLLALVSPCPAQNVFAGGVSWAPSASPAFAGTGLYAREIAGAGTWAFTALDAVPNTLRPFTVTTQVSTGIAQRVFSLGKIGVYVPTAAGISWNGTNTGWAWSTGGLISIPLKGSLRVMPAGRVLKSSVSGGTGYQFIASLMFGWHQEAN